MTPRCENSIIWLKIDWPRKCHKQRQLSITLGEECHILVLKKTQRNSDSLTSVFHSRCKNGFLFVVAGMKKMEYKTRKWHDKCFQCVVCKSQVGSKPFIIPNETDVYCVGCFEEKYATKCTKCKKIMTTGGVTFKNEVIFWGVCLQSFFVRIEGKLWS